MTELFSEEYVKTILNLIMTAPLSHPVAPAIVSMLNLKTAPLVEENARLKNEQTPKIHHDNDKEIYISQVDKIIQLRSLNATYRKVLEGNKKLLEMLSECSGEPIHANDVRPELLKTIEVLGKA